MTKYDPLYPGWYYSYVDIPNLDEIKFELLRLRESKIMSHQTNPDYYNVMKNDIVNCPKLFEYIESVGLFDKFTRLLFSTNIPRQELTHVDGYNPVTRSHFSLNIPLIDCDNSYTAFYKYDGDSLIYTPLTYNYYAWMTMDKVTEIARVECKKPVLVNTTILHRGLTEKTSRTLVGLRFNSPLTIDDMKRLCIKNPLVQEDV